MSVKTYSRAKEGSKKLSENFKVSEFKCKDGSDKILVDEALVDVLQDIRDHFGKAVNINSAYRTESYNKEEKKGRPIANPLLAKGWPPSPVNSQWVGSSLPAQGNGLSRKQPCGSTGERRDLTV